MLTTEATANAHVYIVTLIYGPLGFAPIAATALFIRPVGVAMNTLTDYERCGIGQLGCPSSGTITVSNGTATLTIEFPGGAQMIVTRPNGTEVVRSLLCIPTT